MVRLPGQVTHADAMALKSETVGALKRGAKADNNDSHACMSFTASSFWPL